MASSAGAASHHQLLPRLFAWLMVGAVSVAAGNFNSDIDLSWGVDRAKILNGGQMLTLSLDKYSGSGFQSKKEYNFGRFDVQLKLVPGNSAGTVTTYYLSSQGPNHNEIDFEFLGNLSGDPYIVHTNVFANGNGGREEQFYLWFDPTAAFHTYSIVWNRQRILFLVDNIPIRAYNNLGGQGTGFPTGQPMRLYSSLWNADQWATRGGLVKTDWSNAPFTATYRNINIDACDRGVSSSTCDSAAAAGAGAGAWQTLGLDAKWRNRIRWVRKKFRVYSYCTDAKRFPQGFPAECRNS